MKRSSTLAFLLMAVLVGASLPVQAAPSGLTDNGCGDVPRMFCGAVSFVNRILDENGMTEGLQHYCHDHVPFCPFDLIGSTGSRASGQSEEASADGASDAPSQEPSEEPAGEPSDDPEPTDDAPEPTPQDDEDDQGEDED